MANLLLIEDEAVLARNIGDALGYAGHEVTIARTGEEGLQQAEAELPDLILLDYRLPGMDGLAVLGQLRSNGLPAPVIMMTAHGNIETAVAAMKAGADDFVTKPVDLKELTLLVDRSLGQGRQAAELRYFREREKSAGGCDQIIGRSEPIEELKRLITRIVSTPALVSPQPPSILITGETGTGKDLIARSIHYSGARKDKPFVHLNCTALPEHLVEAELFGHVKGAFTDARSDKRGLLECADGGTIFLDEIGHMPLALQAKLLQTIEHRTVRPVGGTKERKINVLFIAATNRDLDIAIEEQTFREDLYHRLRTLRLHLAPLRERGEDALLLAEHFLTVAAQRFGMAPPRLGAETRQIVCDYDWPGNVRELAHAMESAVLMVDGETVKPEHLNIRTGGNAGGGVEIEIEGGTKIAIDFAGNCPPLEEIEFQIINAAIEHANHNLTRAARTLGISRDAIRYRLDRYKKNRDSA